MSQHYEVIGVPGIGRDGNGLIEITQNEGVRTFRVEMTRTITPFKDLKATYQLYKFFKKEQPFMVHTHTPKAGTVGMLAAKLAGVPNRIHTIAGLPLLEATGAKRKLLDVVEKITYACSTHILPNSFELERIIIEQNYTTKNKLKVIANGSSNGIDTNHYDADKVSEASKETLKKELNITPEDTVFIFIGRVVKDKGVNELVSAFHKLSSVKPHCKLIMVGPREDHLNPLLAKTEALIAKNKNILMVGRQKEIRPYVAISHILTFPSYREGFPNVVLQASSMNLPCIVSNINGCNEIIEDGINGLIIPPKDDNALYDAMDYLMENPSERLRMSQASRSNIIKKYQQALVWEDLLKFYK
ncbi:MAG: glycosyltransferase family 4 protein, partial [Gelidibacter sp.]|nr:glycosyltransferase family 4 protein [Gelidibacter sp.]